MSVFQHGIVLGADVAMFPEPVVEEEGGNISYPAYRMVRRGRMMTVISGDTHRQFTEWRIGVEGGLKVFDVKYTSERKTRLVNVYDQLQQDVG